MVVGRLHFVAPRRHKIGHHKQLIVEIDIFLSFNGDRIDRQAGMHAYQPKMGEISWRPKDRHGVELVPLLFDHGLHHTHTHIVNAEHRLVGMVHRSDLIAALYAGGSRSEGAMPVVPSIT